jgi:hypothetical protein
LAWLGLAWLGLAWLHETKIYLYHKDLIIAYLIKNVKYLLALNLIKFKKCVGVR